MVQPARPARGSTRPATLAALAAAAWLLAGCAGVDAGDRAASRLEGDLARLRAQNAALAERVEALEIRADGLPAARAAEAAAAGQVAPPLDDRPQLEVVRLVPEGHPKAKSTPIEGGSRTDAAARAELARAELLRAESLLGAKKYEAALDAYASFVVRFPEHPRAAEATMRRGECYFHKGQPDRAVEHLEAALAADPDARTAPDALALLARAHDAAGDARAAGRARERLRNEFPDHPVAKKLESREGSR